MSIIAHKSKIQSKLKEFGMLIGTIVNNIKNMSHNMKYNFSSYNFIDFQLKNKGREVEGGKGWNE
jgi:hypothetical protein